MMWFCVDLCGNNFQWQEAKRVKGTDPRLTKGFFEDHHTQQRGRDAGGGCGRGRARGRGPRRSYSSSRSEAEPEPEPADAVEPPPLIPQAATALSAAP